MLDHVSYVQGNVLLDGTEYKSSNAATMQTAYDAQ